MAIKTFVITLRPLNPYYFGGYHTFGEEGRQYYVKSLLLPQQTSLLGLLRYVLLKQRGLLKHSNNNPENVQLIGTNGFNEIKGLNNYGAIQSISPVFILKNNSTALLPQTKDWFIMVEGDSKRIECVQMDWDNKLMQGCSEKYHRSLPWLTLDGKPFTDKYSKARLWVANDGITTYQEMYQDTYTAHSGVQNGVFYVRKQTGNTKNGEIIEHQDDSFYIQDDSFYIQDYYNLVEGFQFAFYLELDTDVFEWDRTKDILPFGGEQSMFELNVFEPEQCSFATDFEKLFESAIFQHQAQRTKNALLLTSDAYLSLDVLNCVDFAITDCVPFNYLKYQADHDYSKANISPAIKQRQIQLVERGSIFYADDLSNLIGKLNNPAWQQIGYNHYKQLITKK